MIVRALGLFAIGVGLSACGSDAPDTVPDGGSVVQEIDYTWYPALPALDIIVVLNVARTPAGASLRAKVAAALREYPLEIDENGALAWQRDRWSPVDIRAFIADVADGTLLTPNEQPGLAWHEVNATKAGGEIFFAALDAALARTSANDPRSEGVVATLDNALVVAATPSTSKRVVVVASTEDDASAKLDRDRALGFQDSVTFVSSGIGDGVSCAPMRTPWLTAWANANQFRYGSSCDDLHLTPTFEDSIPLRCLPHPLANTATEHASCHVRAFVPRGTTCDPARGWQTPVAPDAPPKAGTYDGYNANGLWHMDVCDVVAVEADDARYCEDESTPYDRPSSGWCIPAPNRWCSAWAPRLVGGAAPPWAAIETTCDLAP
jgi:hypothetical protein